MTIQSKTAPVIGALVLMWDHKLEDWRLLPNKIIEVIHQGIFGWIVKLDNYRMIEVGPLQKEGYHKELSPSERHG